jgi:hypothetical protein
MITLEDHRGSPVGTRGRFYCRGTSWHAATYVLGDDGWTFVSHSQFPPR